MFFQAYIYSLFPNCVQHKTKALCVALKSPFHRHPSIAVWLYLFMTLLDLFSYVRTSLHASLPLNMLLHI